MAIGRTVTHRLAIASFVALSLVLSIDSAASAAPASPTATPATTPSADGVWMSPEQYVALYGEAALANQLSPAEAATAAESLRESRTLTVSTARTTFTVQPADPGGNHDGQWWNVVYGTKNKRGTYIPIRLGNSSLGYLHYAASHNLLFFQPFYAAMQEVKPDYAAGAHTEWISLFVNSSLKVQQKMRFIVQEATRTDDNVYLSPDGAYIGVITGYCEKTRHVANKCPNWINDKSQF